MADGPNAFPVGGTVALLFLGASRGAETHVASVSSATAIRLAERGDVSIEVGCKVEDPAAPVLSQRGVVRDETITTIIQVVGTGSNPDGLRQAMGELAAAFDGSNHLACGLLAAGAVTIVRPGFGRFALFHWLRRRKDLRPHEFHAYWSGGHTRHKDTLERDFGYLQLRVEPAVTGELAGLAGISSATFDGVAITRSATPSAHLQHLSGSAARTGMRDNSSFVDVDWSPYLTLWELEAVLSPQRWSSE